MDKYTLKTAFRKSFLGLVWRIEADTDAGLLAIETRDQDTGKPLFSAIDYQTGRSPVYEKPYGDRNWTLAATTDRKLILRAMGQDGPNAAGIACIDAITGNLLWEQFAYAFVGLAHGRLVVRHRNFAGGYEQHLDPVDGNLTQKKTSPIKPSAPEIVLPQRYVGDMPPFLKSYSVHGEVFHYPIGERVAWAFHETPPEEGFAVRLVVSEGTQAVAEKVVLSGLTKMIPELFFAIANQLFFLGDNKREIASYLV